MAYAGARGFARGFERVLNLSFTPFWTFAAFMLVLSAHLVYGDQDAQRWQVVFVVYLAFLGFFAAVNRRLWRDPLERIRLGTFVIFLTVSAVAGFAILGALEPYLPHETASADQFWPLVLANAIVFTVIEELLFRVGFLSAFLSLGPIAAVIIQAVLFGMAHIGAYSVGLPAPHTGAEFWHIIATIAPSLFATTLLGLLLGGIALKGRGPGLVICIGFHLAWNLYILGLTTVPHA